MEQLYCLARAGVLAGGGGAKAQHPRTGEQAADRRLEAEQIARTQLLPPVAQTAASEPQWHRRGTNPAPHHVWEPHCTWSRWEKRNEHFLKAANVGSS